MKTEILRAAHKRRSGPAPLLKVGSLMALPPLPQEFVLTDEAVYVDGKELTGEQVKALGQRLDRARLATQWREIRRDIPVGCKIRWGQGRQGQVIGYRYAHPGAADHWLRVRTAARGSEVLVPASEATRLRASEVE